MCHKNCSLNLFPLKMIYFFSRFSFFFFFFFFFLSFFFFFFFFCFCFLNQQLSFFSALESNKLLKHRPLLPTSFYLPLFEKLKIQMSKVNIFSSLLFRVAIYLLLGIFHFFFFQKISYSHFFFFFFKVWYLT